MELGLAGRNAFITGANRGIGKVIAHAYADEGINMALFGRNVQACEEVAAEIRTRKPDLKVVCVRLDFEQPKMIKPAVDEAAEKLGSVDILVNCAGGAYRGRLNDIPDEAWEPFFAVKPLGLIRMTRETVPHLKKSDQARVINLSGTRGREPEPFSAMAGPINFGTLSSTKVFANEFGPFGITVNAICPGSTKTRRWDELVEMTMKDQNLSEEDAVKVLLAEVPLRKVVMPEDIAALAVFLASARAGLISGCAINVDGGRTRSI
jgi:3-oxoacyl-[acyl-carrier protein] reductase